VSNFCHQSFAPWIEKTDVPFKLLVHKRNVLYSSVSLMLSATGLRYFVWVPGYRNRCSIVVISNGCNFLSKGSVTSGFVLKPSPLPKGYVSSM